MNRLTEEQIQRNKANRADYSTNDIHRQRVTQLLIREKQPRTNRLCVLGAGNCNDLDLSSLVENFSKVHLVDIDADALQGALERQNFSENAAVTPHGSVDVTGIWDRLAMWTPAKPASNEEVDQCRADAEAFSDRASSMLQGAEPFDRIASVCLLSQLIEGVVLALGEQHPRFLEMLQTIRICHLKLMINLLKPGGHGLLVTDVVSSQSAPEILSASEGDLPDFVMRLVEARNFFHGLNPLVLSNLFKTDPEIAPHVRDIQVLRPWRWNVGRRIYAVFAIRFQKAHE